MEDSLKTVFAPLKVHVNTYGNVFPLRNSYDLYKKSLWNVFFLLFFCNDFLPTNLENVVLILSTFFHCGVSPQVLLQILVLSQFQAERIK